MSKRAVPGDVFEVSCGGGAFLVQFVGKNSTYGEMIRVRPETIAEGSFDVQDFGNSYSYVTFYPLNAPIRAGLVRRIGTCDPGDMPTRFRCAGARRGTAVLTWVIEGDGDAQVRRALSDSERALPIAAIWNHEFLLTRVREGWRPEAEG